jgi:hypothetical protein
MMNARVDALIIPHVQTPNPEETFAIRGCHTDMPYQPLRCKNNQSIANT